MTKLQIRMRQVDQVKDFVDLLSKYQMCIRDRFGEPLREMLVERNTFEPDSSYLKFSRYRLEASALGAALLQMCIRDRSTRGAFL